MWRPEVETGVFLDQFLLYVLRHGLSRNPELADLAKLASELGILCLSLSIAGITAMLPFPSCFYVGPGNMNYNTHACVPSTLLTKPSPQPCVFLNTQTEM